MSTITRSFVRIYQKICILGEWHLRSHELATSQNYYLGSIMHVIVWKKPNIAYVVTIVKKKLMKSWTTSLGNLKIILVYLYIKNN